MTTQTVTASVACAVCGQRFEYPIAVDPDGKAWGLVHPQDQGCVEVTSMAGDELREHMVTHFDGDPKLTEYEWRMAQSHARLALSAEQREQDRRGTTSSRVQPIQVDNPNVG